MFTRVEIAGAFSPRSIFDRNPFVMPTFEARAPTVRFRSLRVFRIRSPSRLSIRSAEGRFPDLLAFDGFLTDKILHSDSYTDSVDESRGGTDAVIRKAPQFTVGPSPD